MNPRLEFGPGHLVQTLMLLQSMQNPSICASRVQTLANAFCKSVKMSQATDVAFLTCCQKCKHPKILKGRLDCSGPRSRT